MLKWILGSIIIFALLPAKALDPRNPITLCDRFITPDEQKACEHKVQEMQPDWYLAGICEKQYDDQSFYDCLSLSNKADFPLAKLPACENSSLGDDERMACLKRVSVNSVPKALLKTRLPASIKKAK